MLHTPYIYQINKKQTNHHQFQSQSNFVNIWCYILPTFIKSIKNKQIIINFNLNQISSIFDVTYNLHLSNQSNQSKTNKSSSIWISIKFHKYLMLHTNYINQINQINQNKQIINLNINQISSIFDVTYSLHLSNQSNRSKTNKSSSIWISIKFHKYLMLHTNYIIKSIKLIKNKQIINFNINQISSIFDVTYSLHLSNQSNRSKTNKSSLISNSIKFRQFLMLHTGYIYQIYQIN
jgi:hypothetical protein